jgi:uncharacterized membrane protein YbaN (DUF454 family)
LFPLAERSNVDESPDRRADSGGLGHSDAKTATKQGTDTFSIIFGKFVSIQIQKLLAGILILATRTIGICLTDHRTIPFVLTCDLLFTRSSNIICSETIADITLKRSLYNAGVGLFLKDFQILRRFVTQRTGFAQIRARTTGSSPDESKEETTQICNLFEQPQLSCLKVGYPPTSVQSADGFGHTPEGSRPF